MFTCWETTPTGQPGEHSSEASSASTCTGLTLPSVLRGPVDHVTAFVAGDSYDLSAGHDAVLALWQRLRDWSKQFVSEPLA
jgi:hypothetical protein